ncbi:Heparanase-like protein 3 [Dichanthelium oligosanthes]|uniref:Heparanase-like protein 3 n=1 Tax=Dichanthelium oligosanthes TaxID=888268 RepID=A0A1E5WHB7_9POAL|nr:Heparanase-like protein 3 [Dichanthelium oligosanthes]
MAAAGSRLLGAVWLLAALLPLGAAAAAVTGQVAVDGRRAIAATGEDFVCATLDWWPQDKCDYGTCAWGRAGLLNLDLSNKVLLNAVRAFSPLTLRVGGSLQDKVLYGTADLRQPCTPFVKNDSAMFGFTQGCLPLRRWDELNEFFQKSGAKIVFGLNALKGRIPLPDGSMGGPWDYTNAASLIRYTAYKGYQIHGWELGNELSGNGVGTRVGAGQYAADVIALKTIVDNIYRSNPSKPLVLAPGGFFDPGWFTELIVKTRPNLLNVITHHIYNLGPGRDKNLIEKILNPSVLDGMIGTFSNLQGILKSTGTSTVAWVGEAGGAFNSGHHLVTDAFVFSFWFLDQLGMSAKYDTKSYCRQSLIGGNYGLLNTTTFQPNPDYYSALLWHRLMGTKVLATTFKGTNKIRAYAHCARHSPGTTLLLINLSGNTATQVSVTSHAAAAAAVSVHKHGAWSGNTTAQVSVTTQAAAAADTTGHKHGARRHGRKFGLAAAGATRDEYHLTPEGGDLRSQVMLLNGRPLATGADGSIPRLEAVKVDAAQPIAVAPYSIVFARIPDFHAPACS